MSVYKAINAVQAELAKTGISKVQQAQSYKFRGIDDVYNAIAPLLAAHGLCILPRVLSRNCVDRVNKNGNAMFYVTVEAEFDFVSAEDGTKHTVKTFGEAMDVSDKATNKAMSAAYKYAMFQAFCIPTEGDNDADATTHEVAAVNLDAIKQSMLDAPNLDALQAHFKAAWLMLDKAQRDAVKPVYDARKAELTEVAA
jgi:hypothetical protein